MEFEYESRINDSRTLQSSLMLSLTVIRRLLCLRSRMLTSYCRSREMTVADWRCLTDDAYSRLLKHVVSTLLFICSLCVSDVWRMITTQSFCAVATRPCGTLSSLCLNKKLSYRRRTAYVSSNRVNCCRAARKTHLKRFAVGEWPWRSLKVILIAAIW